MIIARGGELRNIKSVSLRLSDRESGEDDT
jgi:hypothetical protein